MTAKFRLLLAALLISATHGKLLGKLLGSSGCGPSSLQLPRLNLLSMLCRPSSAMSNWMGSGGYGGLGWSGMGSYNQYPGYGGSYGSSYPSYGGYGTSMTGYGGSYSGYGGTSGYGGAYGQGYSSPWTYSPSSWYNQQRKGREFIPKSPGQAINSYGKYTPPATPSKSSVNTNEVVQQQLMQSY